MNVARYHYGAAKINGLIYVAGGVDLNRMDLNSVECYNPKNDQWTVLAPMKAPRTCFVLVEARGYIYALGGPGNRKNMFMLEIEQYDPLFDRWTQV